MRLEFRDNENGRGRTIHLDGKPAGTISPPALDGPYQGDHRLIIYGTRPDTIPRETTWHPTIEAAEQAAKRAIARYGLPAR